MPPLTTNFSGRDFVQPAYTILDCGECGLLYKTAVMGEEDLTAYYSNADFLKWEIEGLFPTERKVLSILNQLPSQSRILDLGCSSGRLLSRLVKAYQCLGCEMNVAAAQRASERGLEMIPPSEFNNHPPRELDAVVLMDVFEHLTTPTELLNKLISCLKVGGKLIISTGNGDAPACRRDPSQFWYFSNVEHVCMITHRHAQFLCEKFNLQLNTWSQCSHYDTSIAECAKQQIKNFAYWQFHNAPHWKRFALGLIPVLGRAKNWPFAPAITCTADHVVAEFIKRGP